MQTQKRKRGAVTKAGSQLVSVWLPEELVARLDALVKRRDSDRSKLIREAIRNAA